MSRTKSKRAISSFRASSFLSPTGCIERRYSLDLKLRHYFKFFADDLKLLPIGAATRLRSTRECRQSGVKRAALLIQPTSPAASLQVIYTPFLLGVFILFCPSSSDCSEARRRQNHHRLIYRRLSDCLHRSANNLCQENSSSLCSAGKAIPSE